MCFVWHVLDFAMLTTYAMYKLCFYYVLQQSWFDDKYILRKQVFVCYEIVHYGLFFFKCPSQILQ